MKIIKDRLKHSLIPREKLDLFSYFFLHMPAERAEFEKYIKKHPSDYYQITEKAVEFIIDLVKSKGEGFIRNKKVKTKNLKKSIEYKISVLTRVMDIVEYDLPNFFRIYPNKVLQLPKVSQDQFLGLLIGKFKIYKLFLIVKTGEKQKHFRCGSVVLVKNSSYSEYLVFKRADIKDFFEDASLYILNSKMFDKKIKNSLENSYKAVTAKTFPASNKKNLANKVLSKKEFGKVLRVEHFSRGLINPVLLATTTKGQYVLKESDLDLKQRHWIYKINRRLIKKNVPMAKQYDCFFRLDGRTVLVFDFIGGKEFKFHEFYPDLRVLMAQTLAKMHKAGKSRSLKPRFKPKMAWGLSNFIGNLKKPEVNVEQLEKLKQKIEKKKKKLAIEKFFLENFNFFMKEAKILTKVIPKFRKFSKGFVFADFYLRNGNLYRGQWILYWDYDFFHYGIQAYDLSSDVLDRDKPYKLRVKALEQFYVNYAKERKKIGMKALTKAEIEAIPFFLRMKNLSHHLFGTLYRVEHDKKINQKKIHEHLKRIVSIWKDTINNKKWNTLFKKIKAAS